MSTIICEPGQDAQPMADDKCNEGDIHESSSTTLPHSIASLELPAQSQNFSSTLALLKRATLSPLNRLRSIDHDSLFVQSVYSRYGLPCIANERCGSWYIPPEIKAGSAYFKSTDGHHGVWAFSTRRLNLHILSIIGRSGGCIIVDSTRRGKRMPDALSKTVPIWCATINRLLFNNQPESHELCVPHDAVSASEQAQIEARLPGFLRDAESLRLDVPSLRSMVRRPLRPSWITPEVELQSVVTQPDSYNKVICCTTSRLVVGPENSENGYIQGAGDDSEGWSLGLTPALFWTHREELLAMPESDLADFIGSISQDKRSVQERFPIQVKPTSIYIGMTPDKATIEKYDGVIACCDLASLQQEDKLPKKGPPALSLALGVGKLGSRALRSQLASVSSFLQPIFDRSGKPRILITCPDGKDLSVGVALAVLCLFFNDKDEPETRINPHRRFDKQTIRRRLAEITTSVPDANPSRATLQSVHAFLMPQDD